MSDVLLTALIFFSTYTYIHTYHTRFIPERVEASEILFRDTPVLPKLFSHEQDCRRDK
jgi:hypothetical protein